MANSKNITIAKWMESLLVRGRTSFTLNELRQCFPDFSETAIKQSLNRLFKNNKAVSVHQGYYIIIPPQYALRGMLPPTIFIDGLMKYLERPYYIGLLSAASFYGAAHQQPQSFYVITSSPALRSVQKKTVKINYFCKKQIPVQLLDTRKTETGVVQISSPELTAVDLVQFEKRIGGFNRAATVINELAEEMNPEKFDRAFVDEISTATLQRLGFLLDEVLDKKELADALYRTCKEAKLDFYRIPLKTSIETNSFSPDKRWKVIMNTKIEIDE